MTREEKLEAALGALIVATSHLMEWIPEGVVPPEDISSALGDAFALAEPLFAVAEA